MILLAFFFFPLNDRNTIIAFLSDARHLALKLLFGTLVVIQYIAF